MRSGSEDDDVGGRKDYLIRNQSASQSAIDNDSSMSRIHNLGATRNKEVFKRSVSYISICACSILHRNEIGHLSSSKQQSEKHPFPNIIIECGARLISSSDF